MVKCHLWNEYSTREIGWIALGIHYDIFCEAAGLPWTQFRKSSLRFAEEIRLQLCGAVERRGELPGKMG